MYKHNLPLSYIRVITAICAVLRVLIGSWRSVHPPKSDMNAHNKSRVQTRTDRVADVAHHLSRETEWGSRSTRRYIIIGCSAGILQPYRITVFKFAFKLIDCE